MTLWIVTTGSSDVELKQSAQSNWRNFRDQVDNIEEFQTYNRFKSLKLDQRRQILLVPSRVLGLVYGSHQNNFDSDLQFPLLKILTPQFKSEIAKPENANSPLRIIVLLTDQAKLFQNRINDEDCPFWQDTCALEPIFRWYFKNKNNLRVTPEFVNLEPEGDRGIDHWNAMLTVVKRELARLECDRENEIVYVSHQAGTPAISSAVQFVTISQFKKEVKFLVSNKFYENVHNSRYEAELIPSSAYWQELEIGKAKRLVERGQPRAALEILQGLPNINNNARKDLEQMVSRFNIKVEEEKTATLSTTSSNISEFEPKAAADRIVDALNLIEIFFENENYIQGVTILAAAQETFLKAAIIYLVSQITDTVKIVNQGTQLLKLKAYQMIEWDNRGLFLKSKDDITHILHENHSLETTDFLSFIEADKNLSSMLKFITPKKNYDEPWSQKPDHCGDYLNWQKYLSNENKTWTLNNINHKKPDKYFEVNNQRALKWLRNFDQLQDWQPWELLSWIGTYERNREDDKRNQLMHNLRGVEKKDVIRYLQGNLEEDKLEKSEDVVAIYNNYVKKPFRHALHTVGLWTDNEITNQLKIKLQVLAQNLDAGET